MIKEKHYDLTEHGAGKVTVGVRLGPKSCFDKIEWSFSQQEFFKSSLPLIEELTRLIESRCYDEIISEDFQKKVGNFLKSHHIVFFLPWEIFKDVLQSMRGEVSIEDRLTDQFLICRCFGVYRSEIIEAIEQQGLRTFKDLSLKLKVSSGCVSCRDDVIFLLKKHRRKITGRIAKRLGHKEDHEDLGLNRVKISKWEKTAQGKLKRARIQSKTPIQWMLTLEELVGEFWKDFSREHSVEPSSAPTLGVLDGNQAVWLTSLEEKGDWQRKFEQELSDYIEQKTSQYFIHSLQHY